MKYIDAEKLYKQVDSLMARYAESEKEFEVEDEELSIFYQGKRKMCSELLGVIDSLQQEQSEADLKKACDAYCKVCGHYPHTVPTYICRQNCEYFDDFKALLDARKEEIK